MIIDGKKIARDVRNEMKEEIAALLKEGKRRPGLAVILVGEDPASQIYVRNKYKACAEVGIRSEIHRLSATVREADLLALIDELNQREEVDGILCQLPLPAQISENKIIEKINPAKDVDGFHPINSGNLFSGGESLLPCTAAGIIRILKSIDYQFTGKHAVVIGRSNIVGKPTAVLLLKENCTVTIAHSKTKNLPALCAAADLLITSAGKADFILPEFTNPQQVIIDVSINRDANGKVQGDVQYEKVAPLVKAITPVPGGVGPMTIAMLLQNTLTAYTWHMKKE